jgi:hypothetical protein
MDNSELELASLIRESQEIALSSGPERHRQETDQCPPRDIFLAATRGRWSDAYRSHVSGCLFCQKLIAALWQDACPGLNVLLEYLRGPESFPDRLALERHLTHHMCARCGLLLHALSIPGRVAQAVGMGAAAWKPVRLELAAAASGCEPVPIFKELHLDSPPLDVIVRERKDHTLLLSVTGPDLLMAGRDVEIEIRGQHHSRLFVLTLGRNWGTGCSAEGTFALPHHMANDFASWSSLTVRLIGSESERESLI